jgi:hypothetical protein
MTDTSIQSLAERAETALADAEAALISEAAACRPPRVRRAARKTPAAATEALPAIMLAPPGMLATREDQTRYLLAGYVDAGGNAHGGRITLVSRASGARYTYRVRPPGGGKAGAACRKCVGGLWQGRPGYPCHTCHGTGVAGATGAPDRLFVAVLTGSATTRATTRTSARSSGSRTRATSTGARAASGRTRPRQRPRSGTCPGFSAAATSRRSRYGTTARALGAGAT